MGTIINMVKRAGSVISSLPIFRNNSFETCLTYDRANGTQRVEFVVVHICNVSGDFSAPEPYLALALRKLRHNPNNSFNALLNLSMEEARLLRDFLNREEVATWLEEEEK